MPERHNAVKVLLFLDVGGSMESHVRVCEELFSAARSEFKHLEYFYFHNFIYESVWKDSRRRHAERTPMLEILRTYPPDYRVIFVGDASMSPYEIMQPGGSIEHWNDESGAVWMQRLTQRFQRHAWLNPEPEDRWDYTAVDRDRAPAAAGAHVPAHARRPRPRHQGAEELGTVPSRGLSLRQRDSPLLGTVPLRQPFACAAFSALRSSSTTCECPSGSTVS